MARAVELRGIAKAYGACVANRDISFGVDEGEIHAVVGENGAGKSTAMKMLYGMVRPDKGEIVTHGVVRHFRSARDADRAGLGMVHQHFMLAGPMSGLDNIVLGVEPMLPAFAGLPRFLKAFAPIDRRAARAKLQALAKAYGFAVDLDRPVEELPVGVQQRLEILKLLYRDARILILDEPTAVLTPQETDELFANLRRLRDEGRTILIITHKLKEVMRLADRVTIFRQGEVVAERDVAKTSEAELATLMVGRAVRLTAEVPPPPERRGPALTFAGLSLTRKGATKATLTELSLEVQKGEIVGIAGVEGNGQSELLALITDPGAHFRRHGGAHGTLQILGKDVRQLTTREVRRLGVGIVPEDRHRQGLILGFALWRNFILGHHREVSVARGGFLSAKRARALYAHAAENFDVRPRDPELLASSLSGGNQQKIVIARELANTPQLFVCAQPTRGVDVGSIEFIHAKILAQREAGAGVLLVSSSLEEILALSDRILVMYDGRFVYETERGRTDEATLGRHMSGASGRPA